MNLASHQVCVKADKRTSASKEKGKNALAMALSKAIYQIILL